MGMAESHILCRQSQGILTGPIEDPIMRGGSGFPYENERPIGLDVAIVGGGPAGMTACLELFKLSNLRMAFFESDTQNPIRKVIRRGCPRHAEGIEHP
jgi:hypothetical protein